MSIGRNDPCPCGSGKKYKKCCQGRTGFRLPGQLGQQHGNVIRKAALAPAELNRLVTLFNAGNHLELERQAVSMLERCPDAGLVWKALSMSLLKQSKDALFALQKAAGLLPGDAEIHYNLGNTLRKQERPVEAEASYRRALQIRPDYAAAHSNLGNLILEQGRFDEAEACYRRALRIRPDFAEMHYNLGNILQNSGRPEEAVTSYRQALEIKPDYAEANNNLGNTLQELGRLSEAETSYLRALQIRPDYAEANNSYGSVLQNFGRFDEAEVCFCRALKIKPDLFEARLNYALARKVKPGDENLMALADVWQMMQSSEAQLSRRDAICLHFALGKCYDDMGKYAQAFPHFMEGGRLKRASLDYEPDKTERHFAAIMRNFDAATIERLRGNGEPSRLPIFILGMPRSGTTLTEQILASHPEVHGAGELHDLMVIAQRDIGAASFPDNVRLLDQTQLAAWGAEYVAGLQRRAPEARHITDKMPVNFMAIGLIHLILPNAKIIHVNRNPVDTCLSCFTMLFRHEQEYTYDLAELGHYYADYARLMEHWRKVLPEGAFLDVQYEDIVADQEDQSRRIIEYCGLEWDDACLDFHKNKRAIRTASMSQARQPIYKSSVERWRAYEKFLGPLFDALGEFAPEH